MAHEARRTDRLRPISGLGPHGEFPVAADDLRLSEAAVREAARRRFTVSAVVHTLESDWSRLQIAGIRATLERLGAELLDVVECGFQSAHQVAAIEPLLAHPPDAIISIPVDALQSADVHRRIGDANVRLVLMDNAPVGMIARKDYVSVVSADNFGNGEIAAEVLASHLGAPGDVLIVGYAVDFPVTNERELGFRKWMSENRPDIHIDRIEFPDPLDAGEVVSQRLAQGEPPIGLFAVWDEPALLVGEALTLAGLSLPVTTVDLGREAARQIARRGLIKGGGAQRPFDQGVAEATAAVMALAGDQPPAWIALPALTVTAANVGEAYQAVWHEAPPPDLFEAIAGATT